MKIAVVGSRSLRVENLESYLPDNLSMLISGGAIGVDTDVREYAALHGVALTEILPDYRRYGKGAPLRRNDEIIRQADSVICFWDGNSRGTEYVIKQCKQKQKKCAVIVIGKKRKLE